MAGYTVITTTSTIQVLTPTLVQDVVAATIQTVPSHVIAQTTMPQAEFDTGTGPNRLSMFADQIEAIMASGMVAAGIGGQAIDENGLLMDVVTFVVSYTPPTVEAIPLTVEVEVPVTMLLNPSQIGNPFEALTLIYDAYAHLIELTGGTPPPPPSTGGTGGNGGGGGGGPAG